MKTSRRILQVIHPHATSDGAGVKLQRVFGGRQFQLFDPFLLMDDFGSNQAEDYLPGFPPHPHRGFETITYMLQGKMQHKDHLGNQGLLQDGDVQWMSAAHGIIHSEMPQQTEGRMQGFQIWLNLPAAEKMKAPAYRDISASAMPWQPFSGGSLKMIAGQLQLNASPCHGVLQHLSAQAVIADLQLEQNASATLELAPGMNVLLYVYQGSLSLGSSHHQLQARQLAVLSSEGSLELQSYADHTRALLLAGMPINEPVVQQGPFVMNSQDEIRQAIEDYNNDSLVMATASS